MQFSDPLGQPTIIVCCDHYFHTFCPSPQKTISLLVGQCGNGRMDRWWLLTVYFIPYWFCFTTLFTLSWLFQGETFQYEEQIKQKKLFQFNTIWKQHFPTSMFSKYFSQHPLPILTSQQRWVFTVKYYPRTMT